LIHRNNLEQAPTGTGKSTWVVCIRCPSSLDSRHRHAFQLYIIFVLWAVGSLDVRPCVVSVEFIWFERGLNELKMKRCIRIYSDDLISIYVHILCIFTEENKK
jgi:hypothetical protein